MTYSPIISERLASPAVARAAEPSLGTVEEAMVRLQSWAAIRGVALSGVPFLRFVGESTLVCLPTATRANPNPQTGVMATDLEPGDVAIVQGVAFGEVRRVAAAVARDFGLDEATMTAEFQRGTDGFGTGNLIIPLGVGARLPIAAAGG